MLLDVHFTPLQDMRQLGKLMEFMHSQDLRYPGYHEWAERSKPEIVSGYKQAYIAIHGAQIIGYVITQPHKAVCSLREIKSLRVSPQFRERDIGGFILTQVERDASEKYLGLIGDIGEDRKNTLAFFLRRGYGQVAALPLYGGDRTEVVIAKFFGKNRTQVLSSLTSQIQKVVLEQAVRN